MAKNTKSIKAPHHEMLHIEVQIKSYIAFLFLEFDINHISKLSSEINRLSEKYDALKNTTLTQYITQNKTNISARLPSIINHKFPFEH